MGEIVNFTEYANQKEYAKVTLYIGEYDSKVKRFDTEREAIEWLKTKSYVQSLASNIFDAPNGEDWAEIEWIN